MIRAVLFDLYETLVTLMNGPFSFGAQLAEEACLLHKHPRIFRVLGKK